MIDMHGVHHRLEFKFMDNRDGAGISVHVSPDRKQDPKNGCMLYFSAAQHERHHVMTCMCASLHGHMRERRTLLQYTKLRDVFVDQKWHLLRLVMEEAFPPNFLMSLFIDDKSVPFSDV